MHLRTYINVKRQKDTYAKYATAKKSHPKNRKNSQISPNRFTTQQKTANRNEKFRKSKQTNKQKLKKRSILISNQENAF